MSLIIKFSVVLIASGFLMCASVQAKPCKDCNSTVQTEKVNKAKTKNVRKETTGQGTSQGAKGPYDTIRICKPGPGCPP